MPSNEVDSLIVEAVMKGMDETKINDLLIHRFNTKTTPDEIKTRIHGELAEQIKQEEAEREFRGKMSIKDICQNMAENINRCKEIQDKVYDDYLRAIESREDISPQTFKRLTTMLEQHRLSLQTFLDKLLAMKKLEHDKQIEDNMILIADVLARLEELVANAPDDVKKRILKKLMVKQTEA